MKLFSRALLSWNEPIFFGPRTRDRRGWMMRGLLALVIFVVMMLGFVAQQNWGRGRKISTAGAVAMSTIIGLFLTAVLDAPGLNKMVSIDEERISTYGNAGTVHSHGSWRLRDVARVRLYPPEEFGRSFGAMEVMTKGGVVWLGVPAKMAPRRIADVLAQQGIQVDLPGWEPGQEAPRPTISTFVAAPTALARVEALDERQAGQIRTPSRRKMTTAIELIPLLVPLTGLVGAISYVVYRLVAAWGPLSWGDLVVGLGCAALLMGGLWLAARFGSLAPALFMRSAARTVVGLRPDALFNPEDPDALFVSVVPRANWGKMMNQATDVGFLKVDRASRCVLFEGDSYRWRIPAQSLVSVAVESYVPLGKPEGPPRPDEPQQERYYLAVIKARVGGDEWEAPVSKAPVEWRPRTNKLREANAIALRDAIRDLLPSGWELQEMAPPGASVSS
jgi:hypothetical protein